MNVRCVSRIVKPTDIPGLRRGASAGSTWKRSSIGSLREERRHDVARLHVLSGLDGARLDRSPSIGARTDESRRFSSATLRASAATAVSAFAVSIFVRKVSSSSPGMRPGFFSLAPSRRATCASTSFWAACAFSSARLGAVDGEAEALAVDDDEHVALLDLLALAEGHAVDDAGDARRDLHALERLDACRAR